MAYRAVISIENPMTGEARLVKVSFNPTALTLQKWGNGTFAQVQAAVSALQAAAATTEPTDISV